MFYLDIPMEDVHLMQLFESLDEMDEDVPNGLFGHLCALLEVLCNLSCEVAVACEFHHDAV